MQAFVQEWELRETRQQENKNSNHKPTEQKRQLIEGNLFKLGVSLLTGDTRAIVQIYLPTTVRGSVLHQTDRENDTQEPSLP